MRIHLVLATALIACLAAAQASGRDRFKAPIPVDRLSPKLNPGYHHPLDPEANNPRARAERREALASGRLATLPMWSDTFVIDGQTYPFTLVGTRPRDPVTTVIPTVIVPIRLTVSDTSVDGRHPVVFDGTRALPSFLGSPIFQASQFSSGDLQFADAMLRAEFPKAPPRWHTVFSPTIAPPLDIVAPPGTVRVIQTRSGKLLAVIQDTSILDNGRGSPLVTRLKTFSPQTYVVFVTYNALEHNAFGYHSWAWTQKKAGVIVYTYTSWLEGVQDAFSVPSPDAATMSHEIAEAVHDPLLTSTTLLWGDPFRANHCFQRFIEVGDAVEFAPARVQLWKQVVAAGDHPGTYTLQTEALLPWFERETPSRAQGGAYSFPNVQALTSAAPLSCVP